MYLTDFGQMKGKANCLSERSIIYSVTLCKWELIRAEREMELSSYVSGVTL